MTVTVGDGNLPPVAIAELADGGEGRLVYGTSSYDPDGDPLTYRWHLVSSLYGSRVLTDDGDPHALSGESTFVPTGSIGQHVVELIVNDGKVDSEPTYVTFQ